MKALCGVLAAAMLAFAAPVPKEFKEKKPDYCPMALGDKREYVHPDHPDVVSQTREITAVEIRDGIPFFTQRISTGQVTVMKTEKTGTYVVSSSGVEYDPPYKACGPDMKEGDSWECAGANGMTRTVGKLQKIDTPAGTFAAYPITIEYTKIVGGNKQVLWYSAGIGMVRYDSGGTTTLVLKKFTPGRETK